MNLQKYKDNLMFLPLGGSGEIGMNVNLYHLDGKWIMIDLGAGFADKEQLPGIDMIAPNIEFVHTLGDNFLGLVLTHAHEDHLGALTYLWQQIKCPIYATPFTAEVLKAKLQEFPDAINKVKLKVLPFNSRFEVGPFSLEMIHLTHSIPEMQAIAVKTRHGTVMHTGDWKFDDKPLVGPASDYARLKQYGDEGVLAMVCDSTNVLSAGHSGSEGDLRESLTKLIGECKQLVAVTTFASNIARVETIARAAAANGRKVVMIGRSLWRITEAGREAGYLQDVPEFLSDQEARRFPRDKLLVICTGCQGEPLAATNKLANDLLPTLRLVPKDTIIFSSKIIPGNDKRIFALFNQLVKRGIEILTEKDHFVHVSGHPSRDELKKMYELVRPNIAVPVHGEAVHLHEHCKWAKTWGVPQTIEIANGDLVNLAPGKPEKLAVVPWGYLAVDGNYLLPTDSPVLKLRRRILNDGVLFCTVVLNVKGDLLTSPKIAAPGMLDDEDDRELLQVMEQEVAGVVELQNRAPNDAIVKQVRNALKRIAKTEIGKYPTIEVQVMRV
jgi:ribonuclease J